MKRNAVAWAALVLAVASFVGSRSFTKPLPAAQEPIEGGQKIAKALSQEFSNVAEFVSPSVVQINVEKKAGLGERLGGRGFPMPGPDGKGATPEELEELFKKFFGPDFKFEKEQFVAEGTGSGFVYDDKGHILTNNHVVEGADKIVVTFHDGVQAEAKIVGTHPETDVAVIKVDNSSYQPVRVGESGKLKVGEIVMALGSPFGLDHTVTTGIVSATDRNEVGINRFEAFVQTDAAINPGNSGGPLVDMDGRVVGINSAIATATRSSAGVGFAIPIDMAARLADKLIKNGKIAPVMLGIGIEPLTPSLTRHLGIDPGIKGVLVTEVGKGTPAEQAGLKTGDVIVSFDGSEVNSRPGLQYLVSTSDAGQTYSLKYLRGGKEHSTKVTPAAQEKILASLGVETPAPAQANKPKEEPKQPEANDFGLAVAEISPEMAEKFGWSKEDEGVIVTTVKEGSPAESAGLEVGDRITKIIQDQQITDVESLEHFNKVVSSSDEIVIYVEDVNKKLPGQFMTITKARE